MQNVYDRYKDGANVEKILFRDYKFLQGAELNELQSGIAARLRRVSSALMSDGDIIRDAGVVVDATTGVTQCASGAVYVEGDVRGVPSATLTIPVIGSIAIGIYLSSQEITELDDPTLLNPAVGGIGYMEEGAGRLLRVPRWGWSGDGQTDDFYPVWYVDEGVVRSKDAPPTLNAVTAAIAGHDVESTGGNYIVSGLDLHIEDDRADGTQVYTIAAGRAHVNGYGVGLTAGRRLAYAAVPDVATIDSEPHSVSTSGDLRIELDKAPVKTITHATITAQATHTITHGAYVGAADALPDNAVLNIVSITQGGTTYVKDTDYKLTSGQVDWSLSGNEPSPGSSYSCTYQYMRAITPTGIDAYGCTITGGVPGTVALITYEHMIPRIDRLCMDVNAQFTWVQGVASDWSPRAPATPSGMVSISTVKQTWLTAAERSVLDDGLRMVPMTKLAAYDTTLNAILQDLATIRLAVDASGRDTGLQVGLFADPFANDSMRDTGIAQDAAVVLSSLTLPIPTTATYIGADLTDPVTLTHDNAAVLSQTLRTTAMQVNPYQAFSPIPSAITLTPSVDRWTQTEVVSGYGDPVTTTMNADNPAWPAGYTYTASETAYRSLSSTKIEYLRQISIAFAITMQPGETVDSVTFDGIAVAATAITAGSLTANAAGKASGKFTIPANIKAGTKSVVITGSGGSSGTQTFSGQGIIERVQAYTYTTVISARSNASSSASTKTACLGPSTDPLAQTFSLTEARQISGIDLWFTAKNTEVIVQIRTASQGLPTRTVLMETRVDPAGILIDGNATRVTWAPIQLTTDQEYALVVICDDAITSLAVAELGKWDATNKSWVTVQPYQVGVLLSSSNANTWTAHQDRDMTFRLLAAQYSESEHLVPLGTVDLVAATDLMVLGYSDLPNSASNCIFEITLPDGSTQQVVDDQPLRLSAETTGTASIAARLSGSTTGAAVLHPGIQLVQGTVAKTATYVSRAFNSGGVASKVSVLVDAYLPSGAALKVEIKGNDAGDVWQTVPLQTSAVLTTVMRELKYQISGITEDKLRVRLTLTGTTGARPVIRNLRAVVTAS